MINSNSIGFFYITKFLDPLFGQIILRRVSNVETVLFFFISGMGSTLMQTFNLEGSVIF